MLLFDYGIGDIRLAKLSSQILRTGQGGRAPTFGCALQFHRVGWSRGAAAVEGTGRPGSTLRAAGDGRWNHDEHQEVEHPCAAADSVRAFGGSMCTSVRDGDVSQPRPNSREQEA